MFEEYFSPENVANRRFFYFEGATNQFYFTDSGQMNDLPWQLCVDLHRSGYKRIIFWDSTRMFYCLDEESYRLLNSGSGTARSRRVAGTGLKTGFKSSGSASQAADDDRKSTSSSNSGMKLAQLNSSTLNMGKMEIQQVPGMINAFMRDRSHETAIIFINGADFEGNLLRSMTLNLSEYQVREQYANRNILIWIFFDGYQGSSNKPNRNQAHTANEQDNPFNIQHINVNGVWDGAYYRNMLLYYRLNRGLNIRLQDLSDCGKALRQAVVTYNEDHSNEPMTGKGVMARIDNLCSMKKALTPEGCYELMGVKKPKTTEELFSSMIGMDEIREQLQNFLTLAKQARERNNPNMLAGLNLHWVLEGNPGTGKTTVAKLIGAAYREAGLLPDGHTVPATRKDLVGEHVGHTAPRTQKKIDEAMGGVLFIDEAYSLTQDDRDGFGKEAINTLLEQMSDRNGQFAVIAAGYPEDMEHFLDSNDGLRSRFSKIIKLRDYTAEELVRIFDMKCAASGFAVADSLREQLAPMFDRMIRARIKGWANGREAEKLEGALRTSWSKSPELLEDGTSVYCLKHLPKEYDFYLPPNLQRYSGESDDSIMKEIDELIGFKEVKEALRDLIELVKTSREPGMEDLQEEMNYHWVLEGNPGTGKTTVAKLIGKVYRSLGLLSTGHTVTATRKDLVGEYIGQTAPRTQKKIDEAMGGVLFIDEAYSLNKNSYGHEDFGHEAIDTLLEQMSSRNGQFAVIAAGYPDDMEHFLDSNAGFRSRFERVIRLEDYTGEEITRIFEIKCAKRKFEVDPALREQLAPMFDRMIRARIKGWSNGREAEKLERKMRTQWIRDREIRTDESGKRHNVLTIRHVPENYRSYLSDNGETETVKAADGCSNSAPVSKLLPIPRANMKAPDPGFDYERDYLRQRESLALIRVVTPEGSGTGSGSVITEDGFVLTAAHVVNNAKTISVRLTEHKNGMPVYCWKDAVVAWIDNELDAAVIKAADGKYTPVSLRPREQETVAGEDIYLWSFPFGEMLSDSMDTLVPSIFKGSVCSVQIKDGRQRINANIEAKRGSSGGALFCKKDGTQIGVFCGSQISGDDQLKEEVQYALPVWYIWDKVIELPSVPQQTEVPVTESTAMEESQEMTEAET